MKTMSREDRKKLYFCLAISFLDIAREEKILTKKNFKSVEIFCVIEYIIFIHQLYFTDEFNDEN